MNEDINAAGGVPGRVRRELLRLLSLLALAVSSALAVNELGVGSGLCGYDSSCSQVLTSPMGNVLPALGVLSFGALFGSSFVTAPWGFRLQRSLSLTVCLGGMVLILYQVLIIGHVCPYCLVVDSAGMAIGIIEFIGNRARTFSGSPVPTRLFWSGAAIVAVSLGIGASSLRSHGRIPGEVPPEVRALWMPGKINIVEVADFQCPQCRRMHAILQRFLQERDDRVHFELVIAPLPRHSQARDAGRAYLCAQEFSKGESMAELLFVAGRLLPRDCEIFASSLQIPIDPYRACIRRTDVDARLDEALAWSTEASPNGLPVTWVQERVLFGVQSLQALRDAVQQAEQGSLDVGFQSNSQGSESDNP